jgi:hypothetical protein
MAAAVVLGLSACTTMPTPFQPADPNGLNGYTVVQVEANRYRLSFNGNTETPRQAAENDLVFLAAQVTIHNGGDWFELTRSDAQKSTSYPTHMDSYYDHFGWWSPHYAGGTTADFSRPENSWDLTAEILVHKGAKPADRPNAYDARDVIAHVGAGVSRTGGRPGPY